MDFLQNCRVGRSWHAANFCNLNLTFISYSFWNIRWKVLNFFYKFDEKRARTPRWVIRFTSKLQVKKKLIEGSNATHIFGREPSNDYFIKILFLLSKWFQTKISIFSNGGHLGYRTVLTDTILKGDHLRIISAKFGWDWLSSFRGEDFF